MCLCVFVCVCVWGGGDGGGDGGGGGGEYQSLFPGKFWPRQIAEAIPIWVSN